MGKKKNLSILQNIFHHCQSKLEDSDSGSFVAGEKSVTDFHEKERKVDK